MDKEELLDILLDLKHDLGKYLRLPLALLPADASPKEVREALKTGLFSTRKSGVKTTSAQELFDETKDKAVVFTCRTGNRSGQVQNIFMRNGHTSVLNHFGGIVTYRGEIEK